jgi:parallel beta-helix repeat protein
MIRQEGYNPSIFGYLTGISVLGSSDNVISNNTMTGWRGGIQIGSSIVLGRSIHNMVKYNVIENNMIGADLGAFLFGLIGKNTFYKNIIRNNTESGVSLWSGCQFLFYKNTITGNHWSGVEFLDYSCYNTFIANNISNNRLEGVSIYDSWDGIFQNKFYYNNFIDNFIYWDNRNVWDEKTNIWYKSEGLFKGIGNYWSDYTGSDGNGDGFGDTPYNVPGGSNKDRFPFMKPVNIDDVVVFDLVRDLAKLTVTMPLVKSTSSSPLLRFLERFPLLNLFIQYICL